MDASKSTPPSGESVSDGASQQRETPAQLWRCTFCGNVVIRDDRPTRCFLCRRGESEKQLNDLRLFVEVEPDEVAGT